MFIAQSNHVTKNATKPDTGKCSSMVTQSCHREGHFFNALQFTIYNMFADFHQVRYFNILSIVTISHSRKRKTVWYIFTPKFVIIGGFPNAGKAFGSSIDHGN